jgi:hypothetical protein
MRNIIEVLRLLQAQLRRSLIPTDVRDLFFQAEL